MYILNYFNNVTDKMFLEIFEDQIRKGKNIYQSHCVVSEQLNIPLHKVNSRYYSKLRKLVNEEVISLIESRKTERQREKYFTRDLKLEIDRLKQEIEKMKSA